MKKIIFNIFRIFVICIFVLHTFITANAASRANTLRELRSELNALKETKRKNDSAKNKTQSEINAANQNITNAKNEIDENKNKIEKAKKDIVTLNEEIVVTNEKIKETIKAYQLTDGENVYLEYVFDATSYEDLVYRYAIVEQIIDYNNEQINKFNDLIKQNEDLQVELAEREIVLNEKIEEMSSQVSSLGNQLEEITEHTMDIQDEIDSTQELLNYYVSIGCGEDQDLSACVSIKGDTGFRNPMTKGTITSYYGYRINPLTGTGTKFHSGIDIGGNGEGTNVYSSANGKVGKIIRKASCGGNQVYVHHTINGKKYTTSYWHLLSINVSIGDKVDSNTVVGTVGGGSKTYWDACSTGPHLHYTISDGWYGETYTTYASFLAYTLNPKDILGLPNKGTFWYSR